MDPERVRIIVCASCGRSLGEYEFSETAEGWIELSEAVPRRSAGTAAWMRNPGIGVKPKGIARRLGLRGPRTGQRRLSVETRSDGTPAYSWHCGCGAEPLVRADTLKRLVADLDPEDPVGV